VPGISGYSKPQLTLVWVTRDGKEEPLAAQPNGYDTLRISPDGTKVALTVYVAGTADIWIWDLVRATMMRLTFDESIESDPLWSPDGKRVFFASDREGKKIGIYWKQADGTGEVELFFSIPNRQIWPLSWSRDGKALLLEELGAGSTKFDIGILTMEGNRTHTALLQEKHLESYPQISPDGRWMAYHSDESGRSEVFVRPFPEVNKGRWQVSTSGGNGPRWSRDGRELFYRNNDAVMAVSVDTDPTFKPGNPYLLFRGTYYFSGGSFYPVWDVSANGKRFLMVKPPATTEPERARRINIVLNWFEELKQRVPVK
jgi:eukaryotic-like serine/threonine-protein kinase